MPKVVTNISAFKIVANVIASDSHVSGRSVAISSFTARLLRLGKPTPTTTDSRDRLKVA